MKTTTVSTTYNLVWRLSFANNYQFDKDGNCINTLRNKKLKKILVGYSVGYCIKGKFYTLKYLRNYLEKIPNIDCPF